MEAIIFVLIGAALFSQSWHVLGMYSEGRTMGVFVGGLGLLSLVAITFAPMLLTGEPAKSDVLAETTVLKLIVVLWALYAIGVGAHGIWDLDDRAIGFYSAFLAVATFVPFLYYAVELAAVSRYSDAVWLSMAGASLILTVIAGIMFFYLAFALSVLRLVAGWFLLIGGGVVAAIGLSAASTAIS